MLIVLYFIVEYINNVMYTLCIMETLRVTRRLATHGALRGKHTHRVCGRSHLFINTEHNIKTTDTSQSDISVRFQTNAKNFINPQCKSEPRYISIRPAALTLPIF